MSEVIKVTSTSFSQCEILKKELKEKFPNSEFNEEGNKFSDKELINYLKDANGAIIGLENMSGAVLSNLPKLKIISK